MGDAFEKYLFLANQVGMFGQRTEPPDENKIEEVDRLWYQLTLDEKSATEQMRSKKENNKNG